MPENSISPGHKLVPWVRLIAIILVGFAVVVRFAHLDRKVYWHDEAFTSMVITARPGQYLTQDLFQTQVAKPADLLAYQQFVPTLTLGDMLVRLGQEDAQHPPLYYVLLRFWAQRWGTDPAVIRSFSALLSLLIFPALYWLCVELFASPLSGWIAIALVAVSPIHLVYGQEAREYGLWIVLVIASSALLLRAIRVPSWRNWVGYGLAMVAAFYTALFSLWIAASHGAYILWVDPDNRLTLSIDTDHSWLNLAARIGQRSIASVITLLSVTVLFAPWAYFLVKSQALGASTSWISTPLPLLSAVQMVLLNLSRSVVDLNLEVNSPWVYRLAIPIVLLQGYALYVLGRAAPKNLWWFIVTLVGGTALALALPDLLFGGQRFTVTRYLLPCFVGLQLAMVYLLTIAMTSMQRWKAQGAGLVFSLLIVLGLISCGTYIQANTWWNKVLNANYPQVAALINRRDRPLIITDAYGYNPASMISLSYLLKPDIPLLLLPVVGQSFPIRELPPDIDTIVLINLPEVFRRQFETRYPQDLTLAFRDPWNEVWISHTSVD